MNKKKKYFLGITCGALLMFLAYALFFYGPIYRTEATVTVTRNPAPEGLIIGTEGSEEEIRYFMKMPGDDPEYIEQKRFEDLRRRGANASTEQTPE